MNRKIAFPALTVSGATKSHTVDLRGHTGRQTVLARWNVADTGNAFYACIDVHIGG